MSSRYLTTKLCDLTKSKVMSWEEVDGIAVDNNGIIYFAMNNCNLYQLKQDDNEPTILLEVENAQLRGIVWNGNNILYICDFKKHRILSYSIHTGNLSTLVQNKHVYEDSITESCFKNPQGITLDRNGDLYVAAEQYIFKIDISKHVINVSIGHGGKGYVDGDIQQAKFRMAVAISVSNDGTMYIADWNNQCVRKIKDSIVSTIQCDRDFAFPVAVVEADGFLLVGDDNGLCRINLHDHSVASFPQVQQTHVSAIAVDPIFPRGLGFVFGSSSLFRMVNTWGWKRLLWIGHMKEDAIDCLLATLPREIVREISNLLDD